MSSIAYSPDWSIYCMRSEAQNDRGCCLGNLFVQLLKIRCRPKKQRSLDVLDIHRTLLSVSGKPLSSGHALSFNRLSRQNIQVVRSPIFFMNIKQDIINPIPTAKIKSQNVDNNTVPRALLTLLNLP